MPIYEFYCPDCNTVFNFLSRTINTQKSPDCPKCDRKTLDRKVSLFAVTKKGGKTDDAGGEGESGDSMDNLPFDEAKMAGAMETLAKEAEHINEDDPRAAARLMNRLSDMTGLQYGEKMQEAIGRMEAGEDPESIEAELGDSLESEDPFVMPEGKDATSKAGRGRKKTPVRDPGLYEL